MDVACALRTATGSVFRFTETFYVTELAGYDAILGMSWLKRFNPQVDWAKRSLLLTYDPSDPKSTKHVIRPIPDHVRDTPKDPECNLVTLGQVRQMHKDQTVAEVFAVLIRDGTATPMDLAPVKLDPGSGTLPSALRALLDEYKDTLPQKLYAKPSKC